jgi:hypothetical protein
MAAATAKANGEEMTVTSEMAARELLDVAPAIVRAIRAEMRSHRLAELSVPQFRTMGYPVSIHI